VADVPSGLSLTSPQETIKNILRLTVLEVARYGQNWTRCGRKCLRCSPRIWCRKWGNPEITSVKWPRFEPRTSWIQTRKANHWSRKPGQSPMMSDNRQISTGIFTWQLSQALEGLLKLSSYCETLLLGNLTRKNPTFFFFFVSLLYWTSKQWRNTHREAEAVWTRNVAVKSIERCNSDFRAACVNYTSRGGKYCGRWLHLHAIKWYIFPANGEIKTLI
jgi:hypothetical protein